tara:strand:+ start:402 stop:563 length:162 start_codon:yes stop_codon:yes gene_type:complete
MQTLLLNGGAGFIGSHKFLVLLENNFRVLVNDSLINSSKLSIQRVRKIIEKSI